MVVIVVLFAVALLWIVPVYFAAKITDTRGRGTASGVLLGLFLGWIGVLVAVLLSESAAAAQLSATTTQQRPGKRRDLPYRSESLPHSVPRRACTSATCPRRNMSTTEWECAMCGAPTQLVTGLSATARAATQSRVRTRLCTTVGCAYQGVPTVRWACEGCGSITRRTEAAT
jgi:hypothetical protein